MITKEELISFETNIADLFNTGKLKQLVHLSGGNEDQLIRIFNTYYKKGDWILSTHRSHYHYLLAGGRQEILLQKIKDGDSMHICDKSINFISTSILAGLCSTAVGISILLKGNKVLCFVGDGATDEGYFHEAVRYVEHNNLPCMFIIENNDLSVDTPADVRMGEYHGYQNCVYTYFYKRKYPHVNTGTFVKEYV